MLPIFFIVGLINIFSQHYNYGIKIEDPNFDIRVRRSIDGTGKHNDFSLNNIVEKYLKNGVLKREKRYAYYKKTRITDNDLYRFNNTQGNNNNGSQSRNGNRYDIFNPNWNFLLNTTRNNSNNSGVNNRPIIRSYPYGYLPGYGPKPNGATGSDGLPTTPGYRNDNNNNTPYFYNYQNPDVQNFAGFVGNTANKSGYNNFTPGYNNIPVPYAPMYTPRGNSPGVNNYPPWNNHLAPYPPNYTQNPLSNTIDNSFTAANDFNNNSGIHSLPYASKSVNGVYNNFNSIPTPFNKVNLSPYSNFNNGSATSNFNNGSDTPNFDSGSATSNNTFVPNFPVNDSNVTISNVNATVTTTEKMIIASGCVIMCNINIPCPQFMRRFGRLCVPEEPEADDDY